jgi:prepilin-type N-terminal cleavage/methylation domain-containing protein
MIRKTPGFTLVELMVVVAILGILSAVAVPTFKKYQIKSRWTEAKIVAGEFYLGEKTAYSDWGTYVTCLPIVGVPGTAYDTHVNIAAACDTTYKELCDLSKSRYYGGGFDYLSGDATWGNTYVHDNFTTACQIPYIFGPIHANNGLKITSPCKSKRHDNAAWGTAQTSAYITHNTFQAVVLGWSGDCLDPFTAVAPVTNLDVWAINDQKQITHVQIGK